MSENLNVINSQPGALKGDLLTLAARNAAIGWIAFAVTALAMITQNVVMAVMPKQVMASENGRVVGQVVFDEARIRSNDEILGDVKNWVARCTSVNKISIYDDLAICVNHMGSDLAEVRLKQYEKNNYAGAIEKFGCERTTVDFNNEKSHIQRDADFPYEISGIVAGNVLCAVPGDEPVAQAFLIEFSARLSSKTTALPLGIQVNTFKDVEK